MTPTNDSRHEGFNVTTDKISKSSETSSAKSLLNRSNSFSRFLGRSESKRSQRNNPNQHNNASASNLQQPPPTPQQNSDLYSLSPSSPRTLQKVIKKRLNMKLEVYDSQQLKKNQCFFFHL